MKSSFSLLVASIQELYAMQPTIHLMRNIVIPILLFILSSADNKVFSKADLFDTSHFYSIVDRIQFDTLRGSDFTWIIFQPINDTLSHTPFDDRPAFIEKLSGKQKALFYIWEFERAVYGGELGFVNFYYNYKSYYQETIKGLKIINDTAMINVLEGVNKVYLSNKRIINRKLKNGDWKYIQKLFKKYDKAFIDKHNQTMNLLEDFVRRYSDNFVRFKK